MATIPPYCTVGAAAWADCTVRPEGTLEADWGFLAAGAGRRGLVGRMMQRALQAVDSEPATVAACAAITATGTAYLLARLAAGAPSGGTSTANADAQDKSEAAVDPAPSVPAYTGERKSAGQFEVYNVVDGAAAPRGSAAEATPVQPRALFSGKGAKEAAAVLRRNIPVGSPAAEAVREWTHNLDSMADYIESLEQENEQLRRIATPAAAADASVALPRRSPSPLGVRSSEDLEAERYRQTRLEGELEAVSVEIQRVRSRLGFPALVSASGSPAGG